MTVDPGYEMKSVSISFDLFDVSASHATLLVDGSTFMLHNQFRRFRSRQNRAHLASDGDTNVVLDTYLAWIRNILSLSILPTAERNCTPLMAPARAQSTTRYDILYILVQHWTIGSR